jgi:regulator of replication initiation timing
MTTQDTVQVLPEAGSLEEKYSEAYRELNQIAHQIRKLQQDDFATNIEKSVLDNAYYWTQKEHEARYPSGAADIERRRQTQLEVGERQYPEKYRRLREAWSRALRVERQLDNEIRTLGEWNEYANANSVFTRSILGTLSKEIDARRVRTIKYRNRVVAEALRIRHSLEFLQRKGTKVYKEDQRWNEEYTKVRERLAEEALARIQNQPEVQEAHKEASAVRVQLAQRYARKKQSLLQEAKDIFQSSDWLVRHVSSYSTFPYETEHDGEWMKEYSWESAEINDGLYPIA